MTVDRAVVALGAGILAAVALSGRDRLHQYELPWQSRRYLSGAWGRYKRMLAASEESPKPDDWPEIRRDGERAAAEINEIRRQHDQAPIDFDGIDGEVHPEDIGHQFDWTPYDPTRDVRKAFT